MQKKRPEGRFSMESNNSTPAHELPTRYGALVQTM